MPDQIVMASARAVDLLLPGKVPCEYHHIMTAKWPLHGSIYTLADCQRAKLWDGAILKFYTALSAWHTFSASNRIIDHRYNVDNDEFSSNLLCLCATLRLNSDANSSANEVHTQLTRHIKLSHFASTDSLPLCQPLNHASLLCWTTRVVCRKTFYNIRHFYGFSHNLLQKNESHSVLVHVVCCCLGEFSWWARAEKKGKKRPRRNNKSYNESHCLTFTCKLSWRLVCWVRGEREKKANFKTQTHSLQLAAAVPCWNWNFFSNHSNQPAAISARAWGNERDVNSAQLSISRLWQRLHAAMF